MWPSFSFSRNSTMTLLNTTTRASCVVLGPVIRRILFSYRTVCAALIWAPFCGRRMTVATAATSCAGVRDGHDEMAHGTFYGGQNPDRSVELGRRQHCDLDFREAVAVVDGAGFVVDHAERGLHLGLGLGQGDPGTTPHGPPRPRTHGGRA